MENWIDLTVNPLFSPCLLSGTLRNMKWPKGKKKKEAEEQEYSTD